MIKTASIHQVIDTCINVFFEHIITNFDNQSTGHRVGDKYSVIYDRITGEYFYNCTVIHYSSLMYAGELATDQIPVALAIRFTGYKDEDEDEYEALQGIDGSDGDDGMDSFDEVHFEADELGGLEFTK